MRVFVVGASGFIGARLAVALAAEGCEVVRGQRVVTRGLDGVVVDFARDQRPEDWLPRLRGVDVVVNAVGILRERSTASFAAVHEQGPAALFEACIRAGVPKVVQISALGAEPDAPTGYFRSKAAGDTLLSKLPLEWVIVQPSHVFGASGASATLLCGLATLPEVPLPGAGDQPVQPIHVDDLVRALVRLIKSSEWNRSRVVAVGPEPLPLREVVASLRRQLGLSPACFLRIPLSAMRLLARLGSLRRDALLDTDTLGMLLQGSTASPRDIAAVLGGPLRRISSFIAPHEARPLATAGRLWWLLGGLRAAVAVLWIASGVVSLGFYPTSASYELLERVGLTGGPAVLALYGAALLDIAFGLAVYLVRRRRWLWRLQIGVVVTYSAIIALALPEFWLHPFAPMLKNLPLLAALVLLHELDDDGG